MSAFTWYSRLIIWLGALVLIFQAVLARGTGPMTVLAVLAVGLGLAAFLVGIAWVDPALERARAQPDTEKPPEGGSSKP